MTRRIALAACVAALLVGADARGDDDKDDDDTPTIVVSGTGKASASPDIAEINVGVISHGATASEALAANNEAVNALMSVLKERGIAAKDIQTANISVNPQYSQPVPVQPGQPQQRGDFVPKIVGYQVHNSVRVTARKVDKLGEVLDAVVQAGANQMNGISFRIDHPEKLLDNARKDAMADARRKAEILAGEGGVVLGFPIHIREGTAVRPPPVMYGAMRGMAMAAESPVPISAGEQELSVTVQVVYRISQPK